MPSIKKAVKEVEEAVVEVAEAVFSTVIEELSNRVVRGGQVVNDKFYIVTDKEGNLLGGKQYATRELAEAAQGELEFLAKGMEFVNATTPTMADKAKTGKAKLVAGSLAWQAGGSKPFEAPVVEEEAPTADAPATDKEPTPEVDDDDENF